MKKHTRLAYVGLLLLLGLFITMPSMALASTAPGSHSAAHPWANLFTLMTPFLLGTVITEEHLTGLKTELKTWFDKADKEQKETGTITTELKTKIEALQKQVDAVDLKLTEKHAAGAGEESLFQTLDKNEDLKRFLKSKTGSFGFELDTKAVRQMFERKTTIDSSAVGSMTSGVLPIDRTAGIVTEARRVHRIRGLLTARPTVLQDLDFVKVNSPLTAGSPQIETHTKKENAVTFTVVSEKVRTLATWIPASRQIMDDMAELEGFLRTGLPYYVDREEERQLLNGLGTGQDLHGLVTQATSFNTALLPAGPGWSKIDVIGRTIEQIGIADEVEPTFIVLNPRDWWDIRLTKDANGNYILGDPMGPVTQGALFGLTPVVTNAMTAGSFLVGSGSSVAAEIRDRMGMTIEIATQHEDYFARNMVAIRAEKRVALVVYRPGSYITGTFTTSP